MFASAVDPVAQTMLLFYAFHREDNDVPMYQHRMGWDMDMDVQCTVYTYD